MVASNPLGPGKFYGSSLPRPCIHNDPNSLSGPVNFTDPLVNWANEAHWSMMGKMEGNVKKVGVEREKEVKKSRFETAGDKKVGFVKNVCGAPVKEKRRRVFLYDSESEGEEVKDLKVEGLVVKDLKVKGLKRKRLARKLYEDFDKVANKN